MNGILIKDKPPVFPSEPDDLRPWVIVSYGKDRGDLLGLPRERAEVGKPCTLDPCYECGDDVVQHDPMMVPGYNMAEAGLTAKLVVGARRLLIPLRHFPSARSVDVIPLYVFRFDQLSETDLLVALKYYGPIVKLVDDITATYRSASGSRVVLADKLPPRVGKS